MSRRTSLALAVCLLLSPGCRTASLQPSETVADSVSGFSGEQGAGGWSYGYWDRTADTDQSYSQVTDFQLLRHFGGDPINQVSSHSDFTTGKLWTLQDGLYYTALWAEGGSANGTTKLASQSKVEHWAVRRWVSTVNGPVTISGHAAKILNWGDVDSGQVHIVVDGATVFSAATHGRNTDYSVNVTVHIGSLVDFLITAGPAATGGAFGPVKLTATIRRHGNLASGDQAGPAKRSASHLSAAASSREDSRKRTQACCSCQTGTSSQTQSVGLWAAGAYGWREGFQSPSRERRRPAALRKRLGTARFLLTWILKGRKVRIPVDLEASGVQTR